MKFTRWDNASDVERFWAKVRKTDDCWLWLAGKKSGGYGKFNIGGQSLLAHRVAFFFEFGYWPRICLHSCDNPECVRPSHLSDGTQRENIADCYRKGRFAHGARQPNAKLHSNDIPIIHSLYANGMSQSRIADKFGVSQTCISHVLLGRTWTYAA